MSTLNPLDPLSDEVLSRAFRETLDNIEIVEKMRWWLLSPHSAERWLQFEYAHQLHRALAGTHATCCEIGYADIAIMRLPGTSPLWESDPVAKIEMKMYGNWYVQPHQLDGIKGDMKKVDDYPVPSALLVFWTIIKLREREALYSSLIGQIPHYGVESFSDVEAKVRHACEGATIDCIENVSKGSTSDPDFEVLDFHLCVYRNRIAGDKVCRPAGA